MLMFGGAADLSSGRFVGAGSSRDISVAGNSDRGAESLLHAPEKTKCSRIPLQITIRQVAECVSVSTIAPMNSISPERMDTRVNLEFIDQQC